MVFVSREDLLVVVSRRLKGKSWEGLEWKRDWGFAPSDEGCGQAVDLVEVQRGVEWCGEG